MPFQKTKSQNWTPVASHDSCAKMHAWCSFQKTKSQNMNLGVLPKHKIFKLNSGCPSKTQNLKTGYWIPFRETKSCNWTVDVLSKDKIWKLVSRCMTLILHYEKKRTLDALPEHKILKMDTGCISWLLCKKNTNALSRDKTSKHESGCPSGYREEFW